MSLVWRCCRAFVGVHFGCLLRHVATSLKSLMKGVQTSGEVDEEELDDAVWYAPTIIPSSNSYYARK